MCQSDLIAPTERLTSAPVRGVFVCPESHRSITPVTCPTCQQRMVRITVKRDREIWLCQHCGTTTTIQRQPVVKPEPADPRRARPI